MFPTIRRTARGSGPAMLALLGWLALSAGAAEQPGDPRVEALQNEYNRLEREERPRLYKEQQQLRVRAAQEADLSGLRGQLFQAKQAYERKRKNDPEILAAAQAVEKASEGIKTAAVQAQNDPKLLEMREQFAQAERDYDRAQFQGRLARFYLMEIKRRISMLDTVRAKRDLANQAERAASNYAQESKKLAEARRAIQTAQAAYKAKSKELEEYAAVEEAKKAVDEAQKVLAKATEALSQARKAHAAKAKSLPEAKAVDQAKEAYDAMVKSDPGLQAARKAAEDAQQAYRDELEMAAASDGESAEYNEKLKQAEALEEESRAKSRDLREKIRQAERDAERGHPLVKAAQKAYEQARRAHDSIVSKQTDAERKAAAKLEIELNKAVSQKLLADPRNKMIQDELKKVSARMYQIRVEIKTLTKGIKKTHKKNG